MVKFYSIIGLVAIAAGSFIFWKQSGSHQDPINMVHRSFLPSAPETLDPLKATDTISQLIVNHVYDGLVKWNIGAGIEPQLADRWDWNEKRTSVTFYLNPKAHFSDGSRLTAQDVLACLTRAMSADNYYRTHFNSVERVSIVSNSSLKITLKKPDPKLLFLLAGVPSKIYKMNAAGKFLYSGPFELEKNESTRVVLRRTATYYGPIPPTKVISFQIGDAASLIANNRIDDDIVRASPSLDRRTESDKWHQIPMWATWAIGFDTRNVAVKSKTVRQRLAKLLTSKSFIENIFPGQQEAFGLIPNGMPGSLNTTIVVSDSKAKQPNLQNLKAIEILIPKEAPNAELIKKWITAQLPHSGVPTVAVLANFSQMIEKLGTGKMAAFLLSFNAEYPSPYFYVNSLLSKGPSNFFGIDPAIVNRIIFNANDPDEPSIFAQKLRYLNSFMVLDSYLIPLMHVRHNAWMRSCVSDIEFSPISEAYFSFRGVKNTCRQQQLEEKD